MIATAKLITNYFLKGFAGPFFLFFFPFLLLLIIGEAYIMPGYNSVVDGATKGISIIPGTLAIEDVGNNLRSLVGGILASTTITVSFLQMPGTVIEFKNSVILKRIGATRLKMWQFFVVLICVYGVIAIVGFLYLMLVSGLLFATRMTELPDAWNYVLPVTDNWGEVIGFFILFFTVMSLFGLAIGSVVKRETTSQLITTFLFFPTSFLVGGFVPPSLISGSDVLTSLRYVFPHTQPVVGFTSFWSGVDASIVGNTGYAELIGTSVGLGFALIIILSIVIVKFFKWNA